MLVTRILIIVSDWNGAMIWPGGIAEYIYSLTDSLISLGDQVAMLAVVRDDEKDGIGIRKSSDVAVIPFAMHKDKKPVNPLGRKIVSMLEALRCVSPAMRRLLLRSSLFRASSDAIGNMRRVLSEYRPDVVIFGHMDVKLYPLAQCLLDHKVPYGIIAHDSEIRQAAKKRLNDLALRGTMLRGSSWIAANSRHTQSIAESWRVPPGRISIIYPPISHEAMIQSGHANAGSGHRQYLTIVSICRLVRGKGIDLVLRALKTLRDREIPFRYLIGGDGSQKASLQLMVQEFGLQDQVELLGSVDGQKKWDLLRKADVFAMPSRVDPAIPWQEGFGIALVEAAAFGIPAVASTSGGIPDAVIDGETGILVSEESPEEIAEALTLLYRKPEVRRGLGQTARQRARKQFSPEAIAAQFQELAGSAVRG
jgi:glycosyltransferase involved in cell wall biosynthesis